jgi:hypothetical protein
MLITTKIRGCRLFSSIILLKGTIFLIKTVDNMKRILKRWIPLAFVICCFCGLTYVAVQQAYRQSANDPQLQIAEDAASALASGASAQSVIPTGTVNINISLAPYVVVYDASGHPIAGNGQLDGILPAMPSGIFDSVRARGGEDRFTWQPRPGVRSAVVVDQINGTGAARGGFVMSGRSLQEVEYRESQLTLEVLAVFIFAMIGSFILTYWLES